MFADGALLRSDGKARLIPVQSADGEASRRRASRSRSTPAAVRDHWHIDDAHGQKPAPVPALRRAARRNPLRTMPRGARVCDADLVRVSTGLGGSVLVRALLTSRQQAVSIFVPMHWNDQFAPSARINCLVPGISDPVSGQPASKNIPARIERFVAATYGFAVFRRKPPKVASEYWAIAKCEGGWRAELAFATDPADWSAYARELFGRLSEPVVYRDAETGRMRFAAYDNGHLTGLLFLAPEPVAVSRDWAVSQLAAGDPLMSKRTGVLAGRPGAGSIDRGAIVCACFGSGRTRLALRQSAAAARSRRSAKRHRPAPTADPAGQISAGSSRNSRSKACRRSQQQTERVSGRPE